MRVQKWGGITNVVSLCTETKFIAVWEKQLPTNSHALLLSLQLFLQCAHHLAVVAQVVAQTVAAILADKHI